MADVNDWHESAKKKWTRVQLTGRVVTAFQRLPEADQATFAKIIAGLTKKFEPEHQKELYNSRISGKAEEERGLGSILY